ncbi:hypothetical protein BLIN101_01293 [Brevibacterium linens]|uniref:Uncharacterized protein n=1 Tax=Brevibacterium linens TaxID=1703 RepID=A0A2H1IKH9_BRELN|nr:hypothetical protein BLIN101_01293 [Brevibacterium linens]
MRAQLDQIEQLAGASRDFRMAGLGHSATSARAARNPRIGFDEVRAITVPSASDIVALLPTSPTSRSMMREHGFYGRVTSLEQRVGLDVRYLGYVEGGFVSCAIPIVDRFLVGSSAAVAANPSLLGWISSDASLREYVSESGWFREPTVFFRLDPSRSVHINLATGYKPGSSGQKSGLPRVLHHSVTELTSRAGRGEALKGAAQA